MSSLSEIIDQLQSKGSEKARITYARHGMALDRTYGVSVADLKILAKTIKGQQELTYQLYDTGMMEAMYLAGIVANGAKMTAERVDAWAASSAGLPMIYDYTVPWVTIENGAGRELANAWILSETEHISSAGWRSHSGFVTTLADNTLDLKEIASLLDLAVERVHSSPNRTRDSINSFVISVGTYVKPLVDEAMNAARRMGTVTVDVGNTACKVRDAGEAIEKVFASGKTGQKRKTIRC